MITASHNPKEYNGYKLYDETGCQLIPELASAVIAEISELGEPLDIKPSDDYDKSLINIVNEEVDKAYYDDCLSIQLRKDVDKNFKIVFSPEHGASRITISAESLSSLARTSHFLFVTMTLSSPSLSRFCARILALV